MGFIPTKESKKMEIEEFKRMLMACAGLGRRKDDEQEFNALRVPATDVGDDVEERLVCVTSGVSFLGPAIVNRLLSRGYSVRIIVDNEDDIERLRELQEDSGEMRSCNSSITAAVAKLTEIETLTKAFEGCGAVFHTSAFTDPAGLSGYTKSMADIEVKGSENVIRACSRTPSVRNCVLTSSLLASIWGHGASHELPLVINHDSWSDELLCADKKLWYALGKLRAEKAAWRVAREEGVKLTTICPGLITGPEFFRRNPTATFAYLKGAQEMFAKGLLATVDAMNLADAHVVVLEEMKRTASGRYICFDKVIDSEDQADKLAAEFGLPANKICGIDSNYIPAQFGLSNRKLRNLMSKSLRSCYNQS